MLELREFWLGQDLAEDRLAHLGICSTFRKHALHAVDADPNDLIVLLILIETLEEQDLDLWVARGNLGDRLLAP